MKRFLHRVAALAAASCAVAVCAAAFVGGEPSQAGKAGAAPVLRLPADSTHAAALSLPPVADAELSALRESNRRIADTLKPQRERRVNIGIVRDAAAEPMDLEWHAVFGGRAAQLRVTSPGAAAMRLAIELADVPASVEMVFAGSTDPARVEGPVRVGDLRDRTHDWWSPVTEGATQTVEFFAPGGTDAFPAVRIASASHLVTGPSSGLDKRVADIGLAASCNVDVTCSPLDATGAFRNAAESVAQLVFTEGGFTTLCTGTLLADSDASSQVPWFFTANHCFENSDAPFKTPAQMQSVADSVTTLWGFQATTCGSRTPRADWTQVGGGATYLYNNAQSDALFLRLNGTPPAYAYYAGWDATTLAAGASVVTIHHPEGDLKKTSQGSVQGLVTLPDPGPGGGSFAEVLWSSGTTEPGSSGAGLFTPATVGGSAQYLLRGALWGGTALCSNTSGTDNFSRFDQVYPNVSRWLGTGTATTAGPGTDFTDLWWGGASENGWGLNLVQHASRILFGVWYTYDENGQRTWYSFSNGTWTAVDTYEGTLYAAAGPPQSGAFDPASVVRTPVGTFTLSFSDADNGTFRWSVGSQSGTKAISRFRY